MQLKWMKIGLPAALAIAAVTASAQTWQSQNIGWRVYLSGTVCDISVPATTLIYSEASFRAYWKSLTGESATPKDVDFTKEQLVAINLGKRTSGGYEVWVDSVIKPNPDSIVVTYVERRPSDRERVTSQISSPFVIIKMDRQAGKITYKPTTIDGRGGGGGKMEDPGNPAIPLSRNQIEWRSYMSGTTCGITAPGTKIITTSGEFLAYWKQLAGNSSIPKDIDFSREQLIAINLGTRPTGGYSVAVTEVARPDPRGIVVSYVEQRPNRRNQIENVASSPFVIIKVGRYGDRVTFKPMTVDGGGSPSVTPEERPELGAMEWRPYMSGVTCSISTPGTVVIVSQSQLLAYWKSLTGSGAMPRDVDFSREQLVAVNLGTRPTAGYSVSVSSVVRVNPQSIVVTYVEVQPGSRPNDKVTSSPYVIIRMPRTGGRISFKPMSVQGR